MTIDELVKIAKEVYKDDKSAWERKGDMWLLEFHIEAMGNLIRDNKIHRNNQDLTDLEILSIVILEGFGSGLIQTPAYKPSKSNPFTHSLIENLDSALSKTPKCTKSILYRNVSYCEGYKVETGEIFTVKGYFTTSIEDYDNAKVIKWVITPLPSGKTKAHEIYQIYNHPNEYQVEFERHTSFKITCIEEGEEFDTVYITELTNLF